MKKLLIGLILGIAVVGVPMNNRNLELELEMKNQQVELNRLGNENSQLRMANRELLAENNQLNELIK